MKLSCGFDIKLKRFILLTFSLLSRERSCNRPPRFCEEKIVFNNNNNDNETNRDNDSTSNTDNKRNGFE